MDGKLYVSENNDSGKSRIINLSASGEAKTVIDSYHYRGSLAVNPKSGDIYFQMIKGEIHRIPKDGGKPSLFASNIGEFQSMVFNKKGTILFLGYRTKHQIIQIISNQENWKNP